MDSITVKNLGKAYKQYNKKFDRLIEWIDPFHKPRHQLKWILKDINFNIRKGEAVGIIGINGAGKSTLLKMITGTTKPSSGEIHIVGKIAALLELGMGFHPDFTGRDNSFMAAQLLGYTESEIIKIIPEIESFANIGSYFDQPIRTYSSGMQARVAFSVATSMKPDILIVDEALSVGDLAFQAKCMHRMEQLLNQGVTVLFVSHSLNQIRQFCQRAIYIANGKIKAIGEASSVCDIYQNSLIDKSEKITDQHNSATEQVTHTQSIEKDPSLRANSLPIDTGSMELEFLNFSMQLSNSMRQQAQFSAHDRVVIQTAIYANENVPEGATVGLLIGDKTGYPLLSCNSNYYGKHLPHMNKGEIAIISWEFTLPFASGEYRIDIGIKPDVYSTKFYDRVFCAGVFTVTPPNNLLKNNFGGMLYADAMVEITKI